MSEARAYQTALHQGNEALAQLHQEAAVQWIKQRANEAFSHEHVVCQRLQIELAQSAMAVAHHENHANMVEYRCVRYREQRDAALRDCDLHENRARDANHLARQRYDMYQNVDAHYTALQGQFLELRSMHQARGAASEVRSTEEATVHTRLSAELEPAQLSERQIERARDREAQDCRLYEDSLDRCESLLRRKMYDLRETEFELRNTEDSWMKMLRESDAIGPRFLVTIAK